MLCLALLTSILAGVAPAPAHAQAERAVLATIGFDPTEVAPGGLGTAGVNVVNSGPGSSGAPLELTLSVPSGVTVDSFTTDDEYLSWDCGGSGPDTTCTLVDRSSGTPVALDGQEIASGHLTVAAGPSASIGTGLTVGMSLAAPGDGIPPDLGEAGATVVFPPLADGESLALDVSSDFVGILFPGEEDTVTTRIRNLGPAPLGGHGSPTTVSGVLPPGASAWSGTGSGWSCSGGGGGPTCTWAGAAVGAGSSLPDLILEYVTPPGLTPAGEEIAWTRIVSAARSLGGASTVVETEQATIVIAPPPPEVGVVATGLTPPAVEAPGEVVVDLTVFGSKLTRPATEVVLGAELPAGIEMAGLTSTDAWVCDPDPTVLGCRRSADFGEAPSSDLSVTLGVTPDAAIQATPITFTASTAGEPADQLGDNQVAVAVDVVGPPPAGTTMRSWSYDGADAAALSDGSPFELTPGVAASVGLDAVNDGSSPIPPETELVLSATLPPGTSVSTGTDRGAPEWQCGGGPDLRCTITLTDPVPLDGTLPRLRVDLTLGEERQPGSLDMPVTLVAANPESAPELSSAIDVPLIVVAPQAAGAGPVVSVAATVDRTPRFDGRTGELRVEIGNVGTDTLESAEVRVDLPDGVSFVDDPRDGCTPFGGGTRAVDVVCRPRATVEPGGSFDAIVIEIAARPETPNGRGPGLNRGPPKAPGASATEPPAGPVQVYVDPGKAGETVDTTIDLKVLPALSAKGSATPSTVHNQAFDAPQPTVLLDGRASSAVDATHTWRQTPAEGEPPIAFAGAGPGATEVRSPTASFQVPVVEEPTVVLLTLEVTDGFTASIAAVEVTVEPVPTAGDDGGSTGWEAQAQARNYQPAAARSAGATGQQAAAPSEPAPTTASETTWWTWTVDPSVRGSNLDNPGPVRGSRMTLLDNGVLEFAEPADPPDSEEVGNEWLLCQPTSATTYDPLDCDVIGTGESAVPRVPGVFAVLRMTVSGERRGELLQTVQDFPLGIVGEDTGTPRSLSPPAILGDPVVGSELTADPGTWTIEMRLEYLFLRCTAPDASTCVEIDDLPRHTAGPVDLGHFLRVEVTSIGLGTTNGLAASDFFGPITAADLAVTTDLAGGTTSVPNSASVSVTASSTGGSGSVTFEWGQTAGTDALGGGTSPGPVLSITTPASGTGDLQFQVTATDAAGTIATAGVTVTYGESAVPGVLCEMLDEARGAGGAPVSFALGSAMVITFSEAATSTGACSESTTLDMTGATLSLFGWLVVSDLDVHVTSGGVDFSGGTLTAPGDPQLSSMDFRVVSTGLRIPFGLSGSDLTITGAVIADSLPLLGLPGGWTAAAKLAFASTGGEQEIGFGAVAWDTTLGSATTVPDDLPVPGAGVPKLSLDGSAATDRSFSLSLVSTDLVDIEGAGLDFGGTVTRDGAGTFSVMASGSLSGPVGIGPGIALESAALAWDGSTFSGDGLLSVAANGGVLLVDAMFEFTDARQYAASLAIEPGSGSSSWTPVEGLTIVNPTVSGSIARSAGSTAVSLQIGAAGISTGSALAFEDLLFELDAVCAASCDTSLALSGTATVSVGASPTTVAMAGTLDLATGAFSLEATAGSLRPFDGLLVENLVLSAAGGDGDATSFGLEGSAVVFSNRVDVVIELSEEGFLVSADLGTWNPASGAPSFSGARIVYSSYETTIAVGPAGEERPLPASSVHLAASTTAPTWFVDLVGSDPGQASVFGALDLAAEDFDVEISFDLPPGTRLFDVGGVALGLAGASFEVESTGGFITSGLRADGELGLPGFDAATPSSSVPATFSATYSPTSGLAGTVSVIGDWPDAFGVPDLVVSDLSVGVSLGAASQLLLGGAVTLPPAWAGPIGITPGTAVALVASVGGLGSCFGIEVGDAGGGETVIDLGSAGILTADHLSIVIAPTGCAVDETELAPGASLLFDGDVFGTPVTLNASVRPVPFELDAEVEIGDITLDGFRLRGTTLAVSLAPTSQRLAFNADAVVLGVSAAVSGDFARTSAGTRVDLAGVFSSPDLGGFTLDRLAVTLSFKQSAGEVSGSYGAEADIEVLGAPQHVALELTIVNGLLVKAAGDAAINIPIDHLTISGNGHFELAQGAFPELSIDGSIDVDGHSLTQVSAGLTGSGLEVAATLGIGLGFASPPTVTGAIAWDAGGGSAITVKNRSGQDVVAQPGDFRFSAGNVGLGVNGFQLSVDVSIGFVSGVAWADLAASVNLGGPVTVAGSFASNGDFSLAGSAAVKLRGIDLPSGSFSVARSGGVFDITGDITWSVPKLATVRFQGSFTGRDPVYGMSFDLQGSGAIAPGGYDFGSGTFRIWREVGIGSGFHVDARVSVPGFAAGTAKMSVATNGDLFFGIKLRMDGTIGDVLGNPEAEVYYFNRSDESLNRLQMAVTVTNAFGLPGRVWVGGVIFSGNDFVFKAHASLEKSGSKDIFFCDARYSLSGKLDAEVAGSANSFSVAATMAASAWGKCGVFEGSIGAELSFSYTSPSSFTVRVKVEVDDAWKPTVFSFST